MINKITLPEKVIAAFIFFITAMVAVRIFYSNNLRYIFLLWNLFLAWIPFRISISLNNKKNYSRFIKYSMVVIWLLFFPNALYIVTDLIHLKTSGTDIPVWFDAILLFSSSVAGLMMAFISLYYIEKLLLANFKARHINIAIFGFIFLGSFGVYIGRFLRWNSWDIVTNPLPLFAQISVRLIAPWQHERTWIITCILTLLFSLIYYGSKKITESLSEINIQ